MRIINRLVVHCAATPAGKAFTAEDIRQWHKARGFKDIGYHFVILLDGTLEAGRPLDLAGAHAEGYNAASVGVCYVGGMLNGKAHDTRTPAQRTTLRTLVQTFKTLYPKIKVCGHRDLSVDLNGDGVISKNEWMKDCPSFDVATEL